MSDVLSWLETVPPHEQPHPSKRKRGDDGMAERHSSPSKQQRPDDDHGEEVSRPLPTRTPFHPPPPTLSSQYGRGRINNHDFKLTPVWKPDQESRRLGLLFEASHVSIPWPTRPSSSFHRRLGQHYQQYKVGLGYLSIMYQGMSDVHIIGRFHANPVSAG